MKGTYCLIINVKTSFELKVGSLGKLKFRKGHYIYTGSALNSLKGRITRHLVKKKQKRWHIDYLLANKNSDVEMVLYKESGVKDGRYPASGRQNGLSQECQIAKKIATYGTGIRNFGCSDCGCESHLFRITRDKIRWVKMGMKLYDPA